VAENKALSAESRIGNKDRGDFILANDRLKKKENGIAVSN
jgi:hypothetical protein